VVQDTGPEFKLQHHKKKKKIRRRRKKRKRKEKKIQEVEKYKINYLIFPENVLPTCFKQHI
jgi:hypothetical protein